VISNELTSVQNGEIGATSGKVFLELGHFSAHEHLLHEQSVVGSARDHTSLDLVVFVPACISIDDKDLQRNKV